MRAERLRYRSGWCGKCTSQSMLTRSTEYLRCVSFYLLSTNMNSPLRKSNVESFILDRIADGKSVVNVWAVFKFIQVMINTKRSDTMEIALVRIGAVPVNLVNLSLSWIWETYHYKSSALRVRSVALGNGCRNTHNAGGGLADGERTNVQSLSSMRKISGWLWLYWNRT